MIKRIPSNQTKLMLLLQLILFLVLNFGLTTFSASTNDMLVKNTLISDITTYDLILIDNDADFETYGFPGNGTKANPYRIEYLTIGPDSGEDGIFVSSTTKHFVIQHCFIEGYRIGVYLFEIATDSAVIYNNTCINNRWGIDIERSDVVVISHNLCYNNTEDGIRVGNAQNCIITDNVCTNNDKGIEGWGWSSVVINHTICSNNSYDGINLRDFSIITLNNNSCINNGNGIVVERIDWVGITHNNCSFNRKYGIYIMALDNYHDPSKVENNTCKNNRDGIFIEYFLDIVISNNTCSNNDENGIFVNSGENFEVSFNLLKANGQYGITLKECERVILLNNTFSNNSLRGIHNVWPIVEEQNNNPNSDIGILLLSMIPLLIAVFFTINFEIALVISGTLVILSLEVPLIIALFRRKRE